MTRPRSGSGPWLRRGRWSRRPAERTTIAAIGITNQRETVVAWDRATGEPIGNALVWQDRRTADRCAELEPPGHEEMIQVRTGLLLDPYFSASKMEWMLANRPEVRAAGDRLAFGTIDSWLVWKLTGGAVHATDATNASRTMLMALDGGEWDAELCAPVRHRPGSLADDRRLRRPDRRNRSRPVRPRRSRSAAWPATSRRRPSARAASNPAIPRRPSAPAPSSSPTAATGRCIRPIACSPPCCASSDGERSYALEGSIFVAGSLMQWLRDSVGLLVSAPESEELARSVPDNGGVYMVPALSGLGAPHWRPEARGVITRHQLRHHPRASRPGRAGGAGAPGP